LFFILFQENSPYYALQTRIGQVTQILFDQKKQKTIILVVLYRLLFRDRNDGSFGMIGWISKSHSEYNCSIYIERDFLVAWFVFLPSIYTIRLCFILFLRRFILCIILFLLEFFFILHFNFCCWNCVVYCRLQSYEASFC